MPSPILRPSRSRLRRAGLLVAALALAQAPPPVGAPVAVAQSATTGAIQGLVRDKASRAPLAGVTVVITGAGHSETTITEEDGSYRVTALPPGTYLVTFFFGDVTLERRGVVVSVGKTTPLIQAIDTARAVSENIVITDKPPTIDPSSTSQGITITQDYTKNIPVPGRTFGAVLGTAAGTQGTSGVSVSGSTSLNQPDVGMDAEAYARLADNPFQAVATAPRSTFSIDVDTASYANLRRFVRDGQAPPPDAIRAEELINYFTYADAAPRGDAPFAVTTELGESPWHPGFQVLRVALRSRSIAQADVPARNLVFLLDVSGSMDDPHKLPLLQQAMGLLVDQLRPNDQVAIVVYAGAEGVALPTTTGDHKPDIRAALAALAAGGSTNGAAGITRAYQLARASFLPGGINRVILCTDGDWNVGVTSEGGLTRLIEDERKHGVYLSVLGFGMGNLKDQTMEALADKGNGNYAYIDSLAEARKVLVEQAGATLVTVADDVKLQVEFNPAQIAGYRLIGYEDRLLADRDFTDDQKDAGELGAGHSVTALYELVPAGVAVPGPAADPLIYQAPAAATGADDLLTVKVRYKAPGQATSTPRSYRVRGTARPLARTSDDFRWSLAMAGLGALLRGNPERGAVSWADVSALARGAVGPDREGYRKDALAVIAGAQALAAPAPAAPTP